MGNYQKLKGFIAVAFTSKDVKDKVKQSVIDP